MKTAFQNKVFWEIAEVVSKCQLLNSRGQSKNRGTIWPIAVTRDINIACYSYKSGI